MDHLSASYDVDIAKQYGVTAAALLNKLIYLSRYTTRSDGYCWRTAQEIENELGITLKQQNTAIEKLESAGLIKTKVTYIEGTKQRCKHFLVIPNDRISEIDKRDISEIDERYISETDKRDISYNNNQTVIIKHNNNNMTAFEELWKLYPKKQGKDRAYKAYEKARKAGVTDKAIRQGILAYIEYIKANKVDMRYVKQGSTWFNGQCWDDEYFTKQIMRDSELDEIL